ncbi:MAG: cation:proton antiporter family protein [Nanoarchaeota archaeon]
MAQEVIIYLSLIILVAALAAIIARVVKQPPIIAYLIAGVIVGPLFFNLIGPGSESSSLMQVFAHLGVALLLFIVGLSLDFRLLKEIGSVATWAGLAQIGITGLVGYFISIWIGFSYVGAIYIALALAFSSTVVVVKILSDKKEIDTLHGKIALGVLIIQDFVAAIALMAIPFFQQQGDFSFLAKNLGLVILLIGLTFILSTFVFGRLLSYLARSQEVLFLFGIAWALVLAGLFYYLGFSLEIGALIAGMSLAGSKYALELEGKIKPLRDFFIIIFFVFFGSQLAGNIGWGIVRNALLLSAFVIIGKPIIVMSILKVFGYKKRTNFLTGASLAQISEFSLILVLLGFSLGHLSQEVMSLIVLVAIFTIAISSYGIYYSHFIFGKISHLLTIFESKRHKITETKKREQYDVIMFGYHRIGYKILQTLKKSKVNFVVVDYNPKVILALAKEGVNFIYGDAASKDFLMEFPLHKAKIVISTIPDEASNLTIRDRLKETNSKAVFLASAEQPRTALDLYESGVDYVIIPHHLGGSFVSTIVEAFGTSRKKYKSAGKEHYKELKKARNSSAYS